MSPSPFIDRTLTLLPAALLILLLAGCDRSAPPVPPPPQPTIHGAVIALPGQQDPAELRLSEVRSPGDVPVMLGGRLVWDEDATARVYAPLSGRIESLQAQVGQTVSRGQTLATLSAAELGQAQADAIKAAADERQTRLALERARSLVDIGAVARRDLEAAEAEAERAAAELQRARVRLQPYLAQASAASASLHQTLPLRSPLAGVVVERRANPGLEVRAEAGGDPLFVISDPRRLWVLLDLDETLLPRVKAGARLALQTAAWPEERFEAAVLHVGEMVDPNSRTVKVRARVDNPRGLLRAEMFVQARIDANDGLPLVSADAVFVRGEGLAVFVSQGQGRYERRDVQLRTAGPQWWHVVQGLKPGEKVVVGGALFLNQMLDGAR